MKTLILDVLILAHSRIEVTFSAVDEHEYMTQKYLGLRLKKT